MGLRPNILAGLLGGGGGGGGGGAGTLLDFTAGLPGIFTLSRPDAGGRTARDVNGRWQAIAANAPRLHHDTIGSPLGVLFEKAHTDLCLLKTNPVADPTGTAGAWSVDPTGVWTKATPGSGGVPTLLGTEYQDLITTVYQGVNAAGTDATWSVKTFCGQTTPVSIQTFMSDFAGTGANASRIRLQSGSQGSPAAFGGWEFLAIENETPLNTLKIVQPVLRANRTAAYAFMQMSSCPYCPTPLVRPTDNVAVTVVNEYATCPVSSLTEWSTSEVNISFQWYHEWPFTTDNEPILSIVNHLSPTTDYFRIVGMANGTIKIELVIASVSVFSSTFVAPIRRDANCAAIRLKSGSFMAAVNGVGGTVSGNAGDWSGLDTVYINRHDTAYSNCIVQGIITAASHQTDNQTIAASLPMLGGFI